jgi:hypothetical protein
MNLDYHKDSETKVEKAFFLNFNAILQMFIKANWTELTSSYKTPFFKSLGH